MKVRILDQAKLDLVDGFAFYEGRDGALGAYFLDSLYSDIDSLAIHPVRHGFHWMLSKRFPYSIYYIVEVGIVLVYAVLDCRADPNVIDKRMESERTRRWE